MKSKEVIKVTAKNQEFNVYYNSACPVCKTGIEAQKNKSSICEIKWRDIHENNHLASELDCDIERMRKYLHIVDKNGKQYIGINAFIILWENSPTEKWKAIIFGKPIIKQALKLGYYLFANILYRLNKMLARW